MCICYFNTLTHIYNITKCNMYITFFCVRKKSTNKGFKKY